MRPLRTNLFLCAAAVLVLSGICQAGTYHIAPDGNNTSGDGTYANPWYNLWYAASQIPDDGSTIIMKDGVYPVRQSCGRAFTQMVTIRSETPYGARVIANNSTRTFSTYGGANFKIVGVEFMGTASSVEYGLHISAGANNIIFENCIIHDSYDNDLVKINDGAHHITFRNCLLFNQDGGGNDIFDINTVQDITVEDCILTSDRAGWDRASGGQTHPYFTIKNSGNSNPNTTKRIYVRRNIFTNWESANDQSYVQFAEDAKPFYEAQDCIVENNLFIFNNTTFNHVGMVTIKGGCKNILVRANTAVGHPQGGSAFSARIWTENNSMKNEDLYFYNNIFCDPNGGMVDFSDGNRTADVTGDCVLDNNLYWNNGSSIPADSGSIFDPDSSDPNRNDANGVFANPLLGNPSGMTIQRWDANSAQFLSGQTSIRGEFTRLVNLYGLPGSGSPAVDAANPLFMPADDILGRPRGASPDIGAVERVASVSLTVASGSGSGAYSPSQVVAIDANTVPGFVFSAWVGDTIDVVNPYDANTTIIVNADATVTATYVLIPTYDLTVLSGSGSGTYTVSEVVDIEAAIAPTDMVFDQWTGETGGVGSVFDANTTFTMSAGDATVTATYRDYFAGDMNENGVVDIIDLNIILIHWGWVVIPGDKSYGDANGDGYVDIIDLNTVLIDWGKGT